MTTFQNIVESLPTAVAIVDFHDACLAEPGWTASAARHAGIWQWIEANHRFNACLWDEEDLARRRQVPDSDIAANKRAIDGFNQRRNDATERIDDLILHSLAGQMREDARLHSETAGMMIDRLSILALKIAAMRRQTLRMDVEAAHIAVCRSKLDQLVLQRADLADCLDRLLSDCAAGHARYKIYRQFKMYNDPALNPALVSEQQS